MRTRFLFAVLFLAVLSGKTWALFMDLSDPVPVDRLIETISNYIEEHPDDAHGYYLLGRVHSLAFAKKTELKMVFYNDKERTEKRELPGFTPWSRIQDARSQLETLDDEQIEHLRLSVSNYFTAVTKNPNSIIYALGLGWMLEQGMNYAEIIGPPPYRLPYKDMMSDDLSFPHLVEDIVKENREVDVERLFKYYKHGQMNAFYDAWVNGKQSDQKKLIPYLRDLWKEECLWAYRKSFANGIYQKVKSKFVGEHNQDFEAGMGIIRVLGDQASEPEYHWEVEAIQEAIKVAKSSGSWITPIIFSLQDTESIDDLLAPNTHVRFNMDGMSDDSRWSWVKADTAMLVWDPEQRGSIKSGKHLFGSVTWWLFWENGYQAMAMLDDDRNGYLEENELNGLAVWQDRNQNGVSDEGEVTPIENTEITRFAVHPEINTGKTIYHTNGIQLKNGAWLPSYDWFPDRIVNPTE